MKKKLKGKNETQTLAARTLDNVGQTKKPMEPQGPAIDETVREYQTECGGWQQGANARYAPTSHTSNEVTMMRRRMSAYDPKRTIISVRK